MTYPQDHAYDTTTATPAGWLRRAGATAVDAVVLTPFVALALILGHDDVRFFLTFCLLAVAVHAYNRWFQSGEAGQSWGRKVFGIDLVSEATGRPIGPPMALVRDLAHVLDALPVFAGFLRPLWDDRRQTFADRLVKTVVVLAT